MQEHTWHAAFPGKVFADNPLQLLLELGQLLIKYKAEAGFLFFRISLVSLQTKRLAMKRYNLINNVLGWACFLVAAITYLLTLEPTASFWDCPEFISQGAKLEVGHPPGNPIFMLAARFFVTLFGGGMDKAALAVNTMSALLSAGTILLLFWSVTHLAKRLLVRSDDEEIGWWRMAVIMGSGICGALAYTWSDTFWFSAVEGEVYAFSSFCTALVFWLMLKWENRADDPGSDRYLILIAYVIGVSIAVHLLNLLCIPALGLIYYYRKFAKPDGLGSLIALGVSCVIVGLILYGLVPGFVQMAQWFELLFVNSFGMSYNMGVLIYAIILMGVFIWTIYTLYHGSRVAASIGIWLSIALSGMPFIGHSVGVGVLFLIGLAVALVALKVFSRRFWSICVISVMVIFIGYSSYALLLIRASANTPMNQNSPDNVFALASYLNREQYGDRPLFRGPVFAETLVEQEYPAGSGNMYVVVDDYGRPRTKLLDGYLRNENGGAFNNPSTTYTKVVKTNPSEPDRYVDEIERPNYRTMPDLNMLFTRIYSADPGGAQHVAGYKSWSGYSTPDIYDIPQAKRLDWAQRGLVPRNEVVPYLSHMEVVTTAEDSQTGAPVDQALVWKPGFKTNLDFFLNYQLNHMYWRYFMWNFAGRQNDFQGNGEPHLGNWISGIPVIDNMRLGNQDALPDEYGKGNKGHNVFYMLPLILGLIGLLWQALARHRGGQERGIQQFWVVFFLFFMTGVAIVLYLNQTPGQPRERDYAFAGSFYAFAIWIGLGVTAIAVWLNELLHKSGRSGQIASAAVAGVVALGVPLQMVSQTWDDHDRSGRYTTRDFGFNYLASVDPNAIIFTNGDNDTFPLWYAQEVEGYRTDVRVVNLSYLSTDWYAHQLASPSYEAQPVPMEAAPKDYQYERLAYSYVYPQDTNPTDARTSLRTLYDSDDRAYGVPLITKPNVVIPVNGAQAMERYTSGNPEIDSMMLLPHLQDVNLDLTKTGAGLSQSKVLSLDIVANSVADGWKRPVYFATTVPSSYYLGLDSFLSPTGLAYEMTPFNTPEYDVTADKAYRNVIENYRWGGLDAPDAENLYLDETVRRMVSSVRSGVYNIIEGLMATGDLPASAESRTAAERAGLDVPNTRYDMARQLANTINTHMPDNVAAYDGLIGLYMARTYLDLYMATGNTADLDAAEQLLQPLTHRYAQLVRYAASLSPYEAAQVARSERYNLQFLGVAAAMANRIDILRARPELVADPELAGELDLLRNITIDDDLRIAPVIYVENYSQDEILSELNDPEYGPRLSASDRNTLTKAAAILRASQQAGVDAQKLPNRVMNDYGFTRQQWSDVSR